MLVVTSDYARDHWPSLLAEVNAGLTVRVVDSVRTRREIAVISPGNSTRLALSDLSGLGTREAAQIFGLSPAAIRKRRSRARITTTGAST